MRRFVTLLLLTAAASADPVTYEVRLTSAGKPVAGVRVRLDERIAWSDTTGAARFEYLVAPAKALIVDHPDFERFEREAGAGGRVDVELKALVPCDVTVVCVLAGTGEPVPGALVRLKRRDRLVAALPLEGWAWLDGKVPFAGLPAGAWRAEVEAAGCEPWAADVDVSKGVEVKAELKVKPESVEVRGTCAAGAVIDAVRFSQSEEGLRALATATCGADGRFALKIPAGRRGASEAPHRVVLRARKEGSLDAFVPVEYADLKGDVRIALIPAGARIDEKEPNNDPAAANAAPKSGTLVFVIAAKGDKDAFAVTLPEDGLLTLNIPKAPIALTAALIDRNGKELGRVNVYGGTPLVWPMALRAGTWTLVLGHWGDSETTKDPVEAKIEFLPAADMHERNDEAATAAEVTAGIELWGSVFPIGDVDAYRLRVEAAGMLQLRLAKIPLAMTVAVYDARGKEVALANNYAGTDLSFLARLPAAGVYTVTARHWGNSDSSVNPYRLRLDFARADRGEEAPDLTMPADTRVSGSINPAGDKDRWRIDVRESGTLRVRVPPRILAMTVRVLAPDGSELAVGNCYGGTPLEVIVSLQRPGVHFVEFLHWGNSDDSPHSYTATAAFFPNDSWDVRRNETPKAASRVSLARTITGAIATVGDRDTYRFSVPRRCILTADVPAHSLPETLRLSGPSGKEFALTNVYGGTPNRLVAQVHEAGSHTLSIEHWGNSAWSADRYRLNVRLDFEDPWEPNDEASSATPLPLSTSLAGTILPATERDWYRVDLAKGKYRVFVTASKLAKTVRVTDAAGKEVAVSNVYGGTAIDFTFESPAAQRCWIRLEHWGNSDTTPERHAICVTAAGAALPPRALLESEAAAPKTVEFRFKADGDATSFTLDANADGTADGKANAASATRLSWTRGGVYPVLLRVDGPAGSGWDFVWADARDPASEPDVEVEFVRPAPGQSIESDTVVEFDAWGRDGTAVTACELFLGDASLGKWTSPPYAAKLSASRIAGRKATLRVVAVSERGWKAEAELEISAPPIVNLAPATGTKVTSGAALVEWDTAAEGPSEVVVQGAGFPEKVFKGDAGRRHAVRISGLPAGAEYTWRARTGDLTSEPRTIASIRGIEFVDRAYEASVARDYDQKAVVRVVNHGEAAASLVMHVASEQKDLLVGFVGEGSPDTKIDLAPGEYRDVMLGISAQDAMEEKYRFSVSLEGSFGAETHTDSVDVDVTVKMPKIEFDAVVSEPDPGTLCRTVTITNRGDTITDFRASLDAAGSAGIVLVPAVEHARLEAGKILVLTAVPHLKTDWKDIDATLTFKAIHVKKDVALSFRLPQGKRILLATVHSRQDNSAADFICTNKPEATSILSVPAGPTIGGPISTFMPPVPPGGGTIPPIQPPAAEDPHCLELIKMFEEDEKAGKYKAVWNADDFWKWIQKIESPRFVRGPKGRDLGYFTLGKHLDSEDGGHDFYLNPFKPIRTGAEVNMYKALKDEIAARMSQGANRKPITPEDILRLSMGAHRMGDGTSNVPLAMLTALNVIRIIARPGQWAGVPNGEDYGHSPKDPIWPILMDLQGEPSIVGGKPLPAILVEDHGALIRKPRDPNNWAESLFDKDKSFGVFSTFPGGDKNSSINAGAHYYHWTGAIGVGVLGETLTGAGIMKEWVVKWFEDDKNRGSKETGAADLGKALARCLGKKVTSMQEKR